MAADSVCPFAFAPVILECSLFGLCTFQGREPLSLFVSDGCEENSLSAEGSEPSDCAPTTVDSGLLSDDQVARIRAGWETATNPPGGVPYFDNVVLSENAWAGMKEEIQPTGKPLGIWGGVAVVTSKIMPGDMMLLRQGDKVVAIVRVGGEAQQGHVPDAAIEPGDPK